MSFKELSQGMCMSSSCSQVVSQKTLLTANVFLTHSRFETSTSLKYNENYSCKAPKWLMSFFVRFCFIAETTSLKSWKHVKNYTFCFLFHGSNFRMNALSFWVRVLVWGPWTHLFKLLSFFKKCLPNGPVSEYRHCNINLHCHLY